MLIIDAHLDLSWNALQWNRNLLQSVYTIRAEEGGMTGKARSMNTVAFPEMRQGRIGLSVATLLARSTGHPVPHVDFPTPFQSHGIARGQLAYYRALESQGIVRIIEEIDSLQAHIASWRRWEETEDDAPGAAPPPPLGFVISMEGADPILDPEQLELWWKLGLRLLGPTHYGPGRYAGGTGTELGLTDLGPPLLAEMQRLGVLLDVTHFSDQAFWQALELYDGPVLASHNNCRALVPHQRQFSDAQLQAIIQRDGVIGAAFDAWMLKRDWSGLDHSNHDVTLETVVDHIDYICQLAGDSRHAAIGSDLDGGFGREQSPRDLNTIADLQRIPDLLRARGYGETDVENIMHGNWLRLLTTAWSA